MQDYIYSPRVSYREGKQHKKSYDRVRYLIEVAMPHELRKVFLWKSPSGKFYIHPKAAQLIQDHLLLEDYEVQELVKELGALSLFMPENRAVVALEEPKRYEVAVDTNLGCLILLAALAFGAIFMFVNLVG
jgi:hypothetical protein